MPPRQPGIDGQPGDFEKTGAPGPKAPLRGPGREARRAFVVQVGGDSVPAAGELNGRVQHLATSDGGNFDSVERLVSIMRRILAEDETAQTIAEERPTGRETMNKMTKTTAAAALLLAGLLAWAGPAPARMIANPHTSVTFLSFACSGATLATDIYDNNMPDP